eukprot:111416-Pleurochrysis_carterae.AAC.1
MVVVGVPVGLAEFVSAVLAEARAQSWPYLPRSQCRPGSDGLCANTGLDYLMRTFPPPLTEHAALEHAMAVNACLSDIIACPDAPATSMLAAPQQARLPISMGVLLGVSSAHDICQAAYVASFLSCGRASLAGDSSFPPYLCWTQNTIQWGA